MSAFSIPPCLIGSFSLGRTFTRRCHTQAYTISLEAYNISILYGRTKETFTTCFELQGLSALLDIHMKIITSFERDFLAIGSIPVTREYQPLQRKKPHQTPIMERSSPNHNWRKKQLANAPPDGVYTTPTTPRQPTPHVIVMLERKSCTLFATRTLA